MRTKRSIDVLRDKSLYRSIAFTRKERVRLGLQGLLPHAVATGPQLVDRVIHTLRQLPRDIDRYMALSSMQERNERLFYRTVIDHVEEIMPWIYTPTVGEACREFSHIVARAQGLLHHPRRQGAHREHSEQLAREGHPGHRRHRRSAHPRSRRSGRKRDGNSRRQARALHGVRRHSAEALPAGDDRCRHEQSGAARTTRSTSGIRRRRVSGRTYFALVDEFVRAVQKKYPDALIQFEDFLTPDAYALLNTYRDRVLCFNDDIQGTAAVALAGVYASTRITRRRFRDLRIMFLGAGSAATGIADLMASALVARASASRRRGSDCGSWT